MSLATNTSTGITIETLTTGMDTIKMTMTTAGGTITTTDRERATEWDFALSNGLVTIELPADV